MKAKDDVVRQALVILERLARERRYGGYMGYWLLAKAALVEYDRRRKADGLPR